MMGEGDLPPALVTRFRADLERLSHASPQRDGPLGVAVSGGSDSLALLLLAHAAYSSSVVAATVDHGLRPEAAEEAAYVADICANLSVPHAILRLGPKRRVLGGNIQDRARRTRYWLLEDWAQQNGVPWTATAHHRDDVAEGFLMRANRGAGVRSLSAMPEARPMASSSVLLVRPLLTWTRAELATVVERAGLQPVVDPSNADQRFDRTLYRQLLTASAQLSPEGLARSAGNLRDVEEAIEWMVLRELRERFEEDTGDGLWLQPEGLPFELRRRFVLRAIEGVRQENGVFDPWRPSAVPDLVRALETGRGGMVAEVQARALRGRWHFRPAPPRRGRSAKP